VPDSVLLPCLHLTFSEHEEREGGGVEGGAEGVWGGGGHREALVDDAIPIFQIRYVKAAVDRSLHSFRKKKSTFYNALV
jgi:hypothetical protein